MSMKKIGMYLFACLGLFGLIRLYYTLTDDFRLTNMTYEIPHHAEWEIPSLNSNEQAKLDLALNQTYYYLGKGTQSYVFSSADGKYVLKFFKFKHLKPSWFYTLLPPIYPFKEYVEKEEMRKKRKLNGVFVGYRLSYEMHKKESGLVFIHLNKTNDMHRTVVLKDKIGLTHMIDLDSTVFLLQEKGETMRTVMNNLLKTNQVVAAKQRIRQVFDLYRTEYSKGIYDRDHGVMHNTGFVGEEPIHLDVGMMTLDENIKNPEIFTKDLQRIHNKIELWMRNNYPDFYDEVVKDMHEKFLETTGT